MSNLLREYLRARCNVLFNINRLTRAAQRDKTEVQQKDVEGMQILSQRLHVLIRQFEEFDRR